LSRPQIPTQKTTKQNKVPTLEDAILIVDNDTYEIRDLYLKDSKGITRVTISKTVLRSGRSTRGHTHSNPDDKDEVYHFQQGSGLMILQTPGTSEARFVEAGSIVLIQKGTFHQVINTGMASDLVFLTYYPGDARRPPFQ
jgi:oxalate decarboxylase/phosphoglucose isomerase-like protein (cupin superfamily)